MAYTTGDARWDALGSIIVGLILGAVAIFLILRSSEMLIGKSVSPQVRERMERVLRESPIVDATADVRGTVQGADDIRFKVEVDFNGKGLAERYLANLKISEPERVQAWVELLGSEETLKQFLGEYTEDLMSHLGTEVDELERKIRLAVPKAVHIDIEADAGENSGSS